MNKILQCSIVGLFLFLLPVWVHAAEETGINTEVVYQEPMMEEIHIVQEQMRLQAATRYPNEVVVYEFLRDNFDLNTAAICGILANLEKESKFDPSLYYNDTGGTVSYGLCQWNSGGGRYYTLQKWCASNGYDYTSLEGQLQFMKYELETTSYYRLSQLETGIENSAAGAYEASKLFSRYYEGCSSRYHEERAVLARDTYWPAYCRLANVHNTFNDVYTSDWYYEAVDTVYMKHLMTGMNTHTFGPAEQLSRAQFVVILHRIVGSPKAAYETRFFDVPQGMWYTNAVMWSNKGYVVTGYTNGCFGPADAITREQIVTMLYRFARGLTLDVSKRAELNNFADAGAVSPFAQDAMKWAVGTGIISGQNNGTTLSPQSFASRAECATMIMRFCKIYHL